MWFIVFGGLLFAIVIEVILVTNCYFISIAEGIIGGILCSLIGAFLSLIVCLFISVGASTHVIEDKSYDMVPIDGQYIVDSRVYYKDANGELQTVKLSKRKYTTKIQNANNEKQAPRVEIIKYDYDNSNLTWWFGEPNTTEEYVLWVNTQE